MKLLIENATILTMNDKNEVLKNSAIAIEDDKIKFIGGIPKEFKADKIINGFGKVVMPGLINAHTHMAMSLLRNYTDDVPLWEWLSEKIWPIEAKLSPEDVYWGTMLSIIESIRSGVTCFSDMYHFEEEVGKAALDSGIRARLSLGLIGISPDADHRLNLARELYINWNNKDNGRISVMVAPHAPYTCSSEYLEKVIELAKELNTGIHIHLSESKKEVEDNYNQYGKSPIKYVADIGIFEFPTIAAHCVHLSDEDIDILASKGVSVVNNPGSNLKLGNGFAPVEKLLEKGVNVALGTDGASSNNNQNMFEEINLAALVNKGINGNPTSVPAIKAIEMATKNGAKALGLYNEIGSLEVGKKADLIILGFNKPHLHPVFNVVSAIAYSAQASDVETVIINGNIIMENYEIKNIDENKIFENVERCVKRIMD